MTLHMLGIIIYIFLALLLIFIYLRIGTNKFQKGWRGLLFTPNGIKFGKGYIDFRYFFLIPMALAIIIWKVFFS